MSTVDIIFQPKLYKNESLAQKDKEIALATGHERLVSVVGGVQEVRDKTMVDIVYGVEDKFRQRGTYTDFRLCTDHKSNLFLPQHASGI